MEYVYASMLLHSAKQKINEASVKKVLEAAGVKPDEAKVKALVASLKDVDIEEAIKSAVVAPAAPAAAAPAAESGEGQPKEKKTDEKEQKKAEEDAAAGLGALFG